MRQKWSQLENSKAGKLKKFLSQNSAVKWEDNFIEERPNKQKMVSTWRLVDKELATAFEHTPGGVAVSIDDVVKARRWVAENELAGRKFAKKALDKNGYLNIKGKSHRRK